MPCRRRARPVSACTAPVGAGSWAACPDPAAAAGVTRGWPAKQTGEGQMFDPTRRKGADQILELARRVATDLACGSDRIRVVGWIGYGGKMYWEYAVEIDG